VGRLFPSLAVRSAHRIFHYPVNSKRINHNALPLPTPTLFDITLHEGIYLQGYRWGKEEHPKVLLVHGWSTTAQSMTYFADMLLKNSYQVISYDAPRHGKSTRNSKHFSNLAGWADVVATVVKNEGKVECIIAHSFGTAAVTVASKLGLQTKKLVYIAPIGDMIRVANKVGKHLGISENIIQKMYAYTWSQNKEAFERYANTWDNLIHSSFHVPTLIYHDKEDREIPLEHSKIICKRWTWATLKKTKGLGHRKILDDENVAKGVLSFIQAS